MLQSYKELKIWQKGIDLVEACYRVSQGFPTNEQFGLTSQLRRAAVSVPANIAEGYGRESRKEYLRFLAVAQGSLKELETHIIISERLNYLTHSQANRLLADTTEEGKMIGGLMRKLKAL